MFFEMNKNKTEKRPESVQIYKGFQFSYYKTMKYWMFLMKKSKNFFEIFWVFREINSLKNFSDNLRAI